MGRSDGAPSDSVLGLLTTGTISLAAPLRVTLVAPDAEVVLGAASSAHSGAVFARVLRVASNAEVEQHPSSLVAGPCGVCGHPANPCLRASCGSWLGRCLSEPADGRACDDGDPDTSGEIWVRGKCKVPVLAPSDDTDTLANLVSYGEIPRYPESRTEEFQTALRKAGGGGDRAAVVSLTFAEPIVITVVVHALQHPNVPQVAAVTDQQTVEAIDRLNQRYATVDLATIRPVFRPIAGTSHLRFQLAKRTLECGAFNGTPGIHRVDVPLTLPDGSSTTGVFKVTNTPDDHVNPNRGGVTPWDQTRYLNPYVAELDYGGVTPPGGSTIRAVPGALGRLYASAAVVPDEWVLPASHVLAHEVAHYFDLNHIDGEEFECAGLSDGPEGDCQSEGDLVCDTPGATGSDHVPCQNSDTCEDALPLSYGPDAPDPPDMHEDYMYKVIGGCETMFTFGQVARIESYFAVSIADNLWQPGSIISSPALSPPVTGEADLWIRDGEEDDGTVPDTGQFTHVSSDTWIRRTDDDILIHENPLAGQENTVYVRVSNRSCDTAAEPAPVSLYWAKAATDLRWPDPWDGSVTLPSGGQEVALGGRVGSTDTTRLPPGGFQALKFQWTPPDPALYAGLGADKSHYCLLAHIGDPPEATILLPELVRNTNDMATKNVTVTSELDGYTAYVSVGGSPQSYTQRLVFEVPNDQPSVFDWGTVRVDVGGDATELPVDETDYVELPQSGSVITLLQSGARLRGLGMFTNAFIPIAVMFEPNLSEDDGQREFMDVYQLAVTEYAETQGPGSDEGLVEVGSQLIQLKTTIPMTQLYP